MQQVYHKNAFTKKHIRFQIQKNKSSTNVFLLFNLEFQKILFRNGETGIFKQMLRVHLKTSNTC